MKVIKQIGRFKILAVLALATAAFLVVKVWAGSPHFVGDVTASCSGINSLSISGKEAGLGNETQIVINVTADVQCVNPGSNEPKAANKQSISQDTVVPVQNGKADYTINLAATFKPDCSPPMTVVFSNVKLTDLTNTSLTVQLGSFTCP